MTRFLGTSFDGIAVHGFPVDGIVTAWFGRVDVVHVAPHSGCDIAAPGGTEIRAPAAGIVQAVFAVGTAQEWWTDIFGNSVIVDHGDCLTLYGHMLRPPSVTAGATLLTGRILGRVGSTGLSTGPHLHWGMTSPDNAWFSKDADGGVSRLLDPLAYLGPDPAGSARLVNGITSEVAAVQVLKTLDVANADVALEIVKPLVHSGRATVQIIQGSDDEQIGIVTYTTKTALRAAYADPAAWPV